MTALNAYQALIDKGALTRDDAQQHILSLLDDFTAAALHRDEQGFWQKLWQEKPTPSVPSWFYLYGGVGCGKSMMMDLWINSLQDKNLRILRQHFHEFMHHMQRELFTLNQQKSDAPLEIIAQNIAKKYDILYFDEFHVANIADAMILAKLCETIIHHGVKIVSTSNWAPDMLYYHGLQRERFLPFIGFLKQIAVIASPDSVIDYRRQSLSNNQYYLHPLDDKNRIILQSYCATLRNDHAPEKLILQHNERNISFANYAHKVLWSNIGELCHRPMASNDYLALMDHCQHIFIDDMIIFQEQDLPSAHRFIHLIDIAYDKNCYCYFHSDCAIGDLFGFTRPDLTSAMDRCQSRLYEMAL